jgi:hypothetical protein
MQVDDLRDLLFRQDKIFTRTQVLDRGGHVYDLERWLRRNEVRRVLAGVFVTHTGELTWDQRAWAATLWAEPAALALTSAVRAAGGRPTYLPGESATAGPLHLLISSGRQLKPPDWIRLHGCAAIDPAVNWSTSPPRQREEEAALDLAVAHLSGTSRWRHLNAVAALAEPIQSRRTTPARMLAALERRQRIAHRALLAGVIADIDAGATSVLEQEYLRRVERPHGLPPALRQVRHNTVSGAVIRDTLLLGHQIVELDGREFHQGPARRNSDLERDLDAAASGLGSVRLGWGQVFDSPCTTAGKVGAVLATRSWDGMPMPCEAGCAAPATFAQAA